MSGKRGLTDGEIELAQSIYGNAIDYDKIEIHDHSFLPSVDVPQSPNGDIYYPEDKYHEDFSVKGFREKATFIHEMGHVLQDQNGINVAGRVIRENTFGGHPRGDYDWTDKFEAKKEFREWDLEEQAQFFRDIYLAREYENFRVPNGITKEDMETFFKSLELNKDTHKESALNEAVPDDTVPDDTVPGIRHDHDHGVTVNGVKHASADASLEGVIEHTGSTPRFVSFGEVLQQFSNDRDALRAADPDAVEIVTQAANHQEAEAMFVRLKETGVEQFPSEALTADTAEDRIGNILVAAQEIDNTLEAERAFEKENFNTHTAPSYEDEHGYE